MAGKSAGPPEGSQFIVLLWGVRVGVGWWYGFDFEG